MGLQLKNVHWLWLAALVILGDQVTKQLHKRVNVIKIRALEPAETVARELALFKVSADGASRAEVMQ